MDFKMDELIMEIKTISETEKKFTKKIKKLLDEDSDDLSKKSYKYLKKLEFYLSGGEEFFKDVVKALEKSAKKMNEEEEEKNKEKEKNKKKD